MNLIIKDNGRNTKVETRRDKLFSDPPLNVPSVYNNDYDGEEKEKEGGGETKYLRVFYCAVIKSNNSAGFWPFQNRMYQIKDKIASIKKMCVDFVALL